MPGFLSSIIISSVIAVFRIKPFKLSGYNQKLHAERLDLIKINPFRLAIYLRVLNPVFLLDNTIICLILILILVIQYFISEGIIIEVHIMREI